MLTDRSINKCHERTFGCVKIDPSLDIILDQPKMGSQNQKSGFAQSLKISIFSVPKLQENVQGSI